MDPEIVTKNFLTSVGAVSDFHRVNRIYFEPDLNERIQNVYRDTAVSVATMTPKPSSGETDLEAAQRVSVVFFRLDGPIKEALAGIEADFRRILSAQAADVAKTDR